MLPFRLIRPTDTVGRNEGGRASLLAMAISSSLVVVAAPRLRRRKSRDEAGRAMSALTILTTLGPGQGLFEPSRTPSQPSSTLSAASAAELPDARTTAATVLLASRIPSGNAMKRPTGCITRLRPKRSALAKTSRTAFSGGALLRLDIFNIRVAPRPRGRSGPVSSLGSWHCLITVQQLSPKCGIHCHGSQAEQNTASLPVLRQPGRLP